MSSSFTYYTITTNTIEPQIYVLPSQVSRISRVEHGETHSLLLTDNGSLYAQSTDNTWGECSTGERGPVNEWTHVADHVASFSLGKGFSVWIDSRNGEGWIVGRRHVNTLLHDVYTPQSIPNCGCSIKQVVCGQQHTLLLSKDDTVWAWGESTDACGVSHSSHAYSSPVSARKPRTVKCCTHTNTNRRPFVTVGQIACGNHFSCFLSTDGLLYTCGDAKTLALSLSLTKSTQIPPALVRLIPPVQISRPSRAIDVEILFEKKPLPPPPKYIGQEDVRVEDIDHPDREYLVKTRFSLSILSDQQNHSTPTDVLQSESNVRFVSVACGSNHTLALSNDNELYSCGLNIFGECGLNDYKPHQFLEKMYKSNEFSKQTIIQIGACSTCSFFLTDQGHVYYTGKLPGSKQSVSIPTRMEFFTHRKLFVSRMWARYNSFIVECHPIVEATSEARTS